MEEPRGTAGLRKIRSLLEPFLSKSDLIEAMNDIERSWSLSHEPPTPDEVERWRENWRRENPAAHRRNVFIWTAFAVAGAGAIVGWTLWTALGGDGTASAGTTILAAVQAAVVVAAVGGLLGVLLQAIRREPETETQHFIV